MSYTQPLTGQKLQWSLQGKGPEYSPLYLGWKKIAVVGDGPQIQETDWSEAHWVLLPTARLLTGGWELLKAALEAPGLMARGDLFLP